MSKVHVTPSPHSWGETKEILEVLQSMFNVITSFGIDATASLS
jgi:hypothetical protein